MRHQFGHPGFFRDGHRWQRPARLVPVGFALFHHVLQACQRLSLVEPPGQLVQLVRLQPVDIRRALDGAARGRAFAQFMGQPVELGVPQPQVGQPIFPVWGAVLSPAQQLQEPLPAQPAQALADGLFRLLAALHHRLLARVRVDPTAAEIGLDRLDQWGRLIGWGGLGEVQVVDGVPVFLQIGAEAGGKLAGYRLVRGDVRRRGSRHASRRLQRSTNLFGRRLQQVVCQPGLAPGPLGQIEQGLLGLQRFIVQPQQERLGFRVAVVLDQGVVVASKSDLAALRRWDDA